ncbi:MAG: glycosyltransferase [Lachnospiraceae bacterium]|nr:glycosyltransferase [Lachnospiraceae bacterium]
MRKIFFPQWESLGQDFVIRAFRDEGFTVDLYKIPKSEPDQEKRAGLAEELVNKIIAESYDFVFTVNFLPVVAIACKALRISYLSWIYDSPCVEVYSETAAFENNYIFIFDRMICADLISKGINTVYYLPLAADVSYYDEIIAANSNDFTNDISFVGSRYAETKPQFAPLENDEGYLKGYLDGLIKAQLGVYGVNFLEAALTPEIIIRMQALCMLPQRVHSNESIAWLYANHYLAKKVTSLERTGIFRRLAEEQKGFRLYSGESTSEYPEIVNKGYVDYYCQLPLVFNHSKINLNITLKSIQSGIPLRAFDIMGAGGFLLTNFQADFLLHFVPDEDYVYYENIDDLINKTEYYLTHDKERRQIAENGYEKVKQHHTYRHRVREMLSIMYKE